MKDGREMASERDGQDSYTRNWRLLSGHHGRRAPNCMALLFTIRAQTRSGQPTSAAARHATPFVDDGHRRPPSRSSGITAASELGT
jgi:hypothetical protein